MTGEDQEPRRAPAGHRTLELLGAQIAARDIHVGGGSAAAAAASLAAASAELVVSLSIRKKTPADVRGGLERDRDRLAALRDELLAAADADESALSNLMHAYSLKSPGQGDLIATAADSALAIARLAGEVVELSGANIEHASQFTVSDLGSAAAIAHGALEAAYLTALVNIELLAAVIGDHDPTVGARRDELSSMRVRSKTAVEQALTRAAGRIGSTKRAGA